MIKAVIFDNDGVLVDSEPLHHIAEKKTLARYGIDFTDKDFKMYVGIGWHKMLTDWIQKYHLPATPEEMRQIHEQNLIQVFLERVEPTPNIFDFLGYLKDQKYRLGVGSSSSRILVETGLRKTGLLDFFETLVCSEDVADKTKPDPDIYLLAAQRLRAKPSECVAIEDSRTGIKAAKAAEMKCVGYRNSNSGEQDLSQADLIVGDFRELKGWL